MAQYTQQFKERVRELYGSQFDEMLDNGDAFLGRYLDDSSSGGFPIDDILLATSLDKLQKQARIMKMKRELYADYWKQRGVK